MSTSTLNNWLVSAWLSSPLAGDPPALDGVLGWELSCRLGMKHHKKAGRWTPPEEILDVPIPLAKRTLDGVGVYCCSDPIIPEPMAPEWVDRISKRFESSKMALVVAPDQRKSVMVASGPYKSRFAPERIRAVKRVCWFVRGERKGMNKLLKSVHSIGKHRAIGYGRVWTWSYEPAIEDYSIFANNKGKKVLMKTLPAKVNLENVCGYKKSFGGYRPPYWHPAFQTEVVTPC
ncbi:MAG: hypothetical protein FWG40_00560 [Peptococcaceae bacterium]|nr:hypothetical protein [Peptococcaceae bacterium]